MNGRPATTNFFYTLDSKKAQKVIKDLSHRNMKYLGMALVNEVHKQVRIILQPYITSSQITIPSK